MAISYLYVGVLEHGDSQKKWFQKDGVRRVGFFPCKSDVIFMQAS